MASKVYFTDLHAREGSNLLVKLKRLMKAAGYKSVWRLGTGDALFEEDPLV